MEDSYFYVRISSIFGPPLLFFFDGHTLFAILAACAIRASWERDGGHQLLFFGVAVTTFINYIIIIIIIIKHYHN